MSERPNLPALDEDRWDLTLLPVLQDAQDSLDTHDADLAGHATRLTTAESTITSLDSRLDTAEPTIASHTSTLATQASTISTHTATLSAHTTELADHEVRVTAAEGGVQRVTGRQTTLLYDDFSTYPDGSPNGHAVAIGGVNWATTGTVPPVVTSGKLSSTGSGYLYTTVSARPIAVEAEVSFGGSGNDNSACTIAICKTAGATLIDNIAHMIFGPTGANLQLNKDATGTFDFILAAEWPEIPKDGTKARIRLVIRGDRAIIYGPDGSAWPTRDRRIGDTLGAAYQTIFLQASTAGTTKAYLHTVTVFGDAASGLPALADRLSASPVEATINPANTIFQRGKPWQIKAGAQASAANPSLIFGLAAGEMRALLREDASIGATTIKTDVPMYGFGSITIGYGNQTETVTVSGTSGTGDPYTITVSALTKNHSYNEPITNPTARRVEVPFNLALGLLELPAATYIAGRFELGNNRDTGIDRSAAGVVRASAASGGVVVFRTGNGTTASRPSASTVGAGAFYFDTTIGKPIWSTGSAWILSDGTAA